MKSKFVKVEVEREIDAKYGAYSFIVLAIVNIIYLLYLEYINNYNSLEVVGVIFISFFIVTILSYIISYICGDSYVKIKR